MADVEDEDLTLELAWAAGFFDGEGSTNTREIKKELAWAAGFFDAEGSCHPKHTGQGGRSAPGYSYMYVVMNLSQTDLRPLERFQRAVGVGKIVDADSRSRIAKGWKQCWRWQVQRTEEVNHVIDLLSPYLSEPKLEQIAVVREKARLHDIERRRLYPGRRAA